MDVTGVTGQMGDCNDDEDEDEDSDLMGIGPLFASSDDDGSSDNDDGDVIMG